MKIILFVLLFLPFVAQAQINKLCPEFTAHGAPHYKAQPGDQELCKTNYAVIHRCDVKAPVAVFERLTKAGITGPSKRKDNFRPDPDVTAECQAHLADFAILGKTHDRGHMSPAGNNTQNDAIMSESFLLSNMVAQIANNNRGAWKQLETWTREWALAGGEFYVISGGIFDPGHQVVGNGLGVPTRLYKIIIDKKSDKIMAFLMPNAPIPVPEILDYVVPVSEIEKATGMKFNLTAPRDTK